MSAKQNADEREAALKGYEELIAAACRLLRAHAWRSYLDDDCEPWWAPEEEWSTPGSPYPKGFPNSFGMTVQEALIEQAGWMENLGWNRPTGRVS